MMGYLYRLPIALIWGMIAILFVGFLMVIPALAVLYLPPVVAAVVVVGYAMALVPARYRVQFMERFRG